VEKIWNQFAKKHENIFLVLCGHLSVGHKSLKGENGNTVHALLADYQGLDYGGQGWLRIMKFIPGKDVIEVDTYSTRKNKFFGKEDGKYSNHEMNDFDLKYEMNPN